MKIISHEIMKEPCTYVNIEYSINQSSMEIDNFALNVYRACDFINFISKRLHVYSNLLIIVQSSHSQSSQDCFLIASIFNIPTNKRLTDSTWLVLGNGTNVC